jgi:hypothetical protein
LAAGEILEEQVEISVEVGDVGGSDERVDLYFSVETVEELVTGAIDGNSGNS